MVMGELNNVVHLEDRIVSPVTLEEVEYFRQ